MNNDLMVVVAEMLKDKILKEKDKYISELKD
jgi:hypothetical protein